MSLKVSASGHIAHDARINTVKRVNTLGHTYVRVLIEGEGCDVSLFVDAGAARRLATEIERAICSPVQGTDSTDHAHMIGTGG